MKTSKLLPKECIKEIREEIRRIRKSKNLFSDNKDCSILRLKWVLDKDLWSEDKDEN
jgi:hypothetical protein